MFLRSFVLALPLLLFTAGIPSAVRASMEAPPATPAYSLTLDEAVALAFERNPDLQGAAARIAEAEARVGEAASAFYPQVSTRLSFTRTDNPSQAFGMILAQRRFSFDANFNHPGATQDVRPEIMAVLPLFRGGQDYQRRAAAELGVDAAKLERAAMRNALADAVIAAYYALLAGPEYVTVTRASIEAVDSALGHARARFEEGVALKSDVLSLEVRRAAAQDGQIRAENAVELARAGLRLLLDLPALAPLTVAPAPPSTVSSLPETFDEALVQAQSGRPELQAAAQLVAMRGHEVKAEQAAYLPRVDAMASYGQDATDLNLSRSRDNWLVGATAELDLFSGFRTTERVRAARRRLDEARAAEHKARLEVERDVRIAFLTRQEARERTRVTEAAIMAADEALRLVNAQYHGGTVTITRYLEAEVACTDARSRAVAARYDARRAEAGLQKAIGHWASNQP